MKFSFSLPLLCLCVAAPAYAWGPDGHSVVAEIAQRRLTAGARNQIARILGPGVSLASLSSWADDVRETRPQTYNWHFVDIPIGDSKYHPLEQCKASPKGDCVVAALNRLKDAIHCAPSSAEKAEALRYVVHFVGDIHQPFHTVAEAKGGNQIRVASYIAGEICSGGCIPTPMSGNLHAIWDSTLIQKASWSWGALAEKIDAALPADTSAAGAGGPEEWAEQTHKTAQLVWTWTPRNFVIDEAYYERAMPVVNQQLGLAGLRLARLLNNAYGGAACPD